MSQDMPVIIAGAGLAGLTLGRVLRAANIPAVIVEKGADTQAPAHGLVLQARAYEPLAKLVGQDVDTFSRNTAVDCEIGGTGRVIPDLRFDSRNGSFHSDKQDPAAKPLIRFNKRRLRSLLAESLDIRWDHKLTSVESGKDSVIAHFANGQRLKGSWLIGADGVHSTVRKQYLPEVKPTILPTVAINGSHRVKLDQYRSVHSAFFAQSTSVSSNVKDAGLSIALNDVTPQHATISWTYNRPARDGDPLHNPGRALEDAKSIPEEFFAELAECGPLASPLDELLNPDSARKDKLYTWLMRSLSLPSASLHSLPSRIALLGDAAHAMPIVAGEGGTYAVLDALRLGADIAKPGFSFTSFAEASLEEWQKGVRDSERNLGKLHQARL